MPDPIDYSVEQQEKMLSASIANARQTKDADRLRPNGRCYFCSEPLDTNQVFCDIDCSTDHERLMRNRQQRKVA
jgi:predicted nucleic acid-binding Zn ribbon protein